ncbi:MAG: LacI family DNA-binding transcriptional regulator [Pseudotabrizicola sp.]|uniref:LacI family DNA-binding transcriptional regulator n=1 Tax=Pseudotabrizicola sp. TaxID=2939647 RepID=UPI00271B1D71|nr:LacI family DNA-binding transcriptional regulator [Pseudotabrizicola sp.]MDO9638253.1 LacI family DNA-binding transcriptional regulator [Pseudotabrizicola sp.]
MRKVTIRDIAARAALSTATVDRVLNGRPGVSAANRQRVNMAVEELGYLPSDGKVALPSRPAHLEFFIPLGRSEFMHNLAATIRDFAENLPLVASCTIHSLDGLSPQALVRAAENIALPTSGVGLITVDHPVTRNAIRQLSDAGLRVVTIASDLPSTPRSAYVGVDNRIAGRTAGLVMGKMAGTGGGALALFLGTRAYHGHEERENGFRAMISEQFPHMELLPAIQTDEDNAASYAAATRLLRSRADVRGIYCVGAGRSGIVQAVAEIDRPRPFVILHDLTNLTRRFLAEDLIDVVIDQNARLTGEQAVIRLLGSIASTAPFLTLKYIEPRIILRENIPVR